MLLHAAILSEAVVEEFRYRETALVQNQAEDIRAGCVQSLSGLRDGLSRRAAGLDDQQDFLEAAHKHPRVGVRTYGGNVHKHVVVVLGQLDLADPLQ